MLPTDIRALAIDDDEITLKFYRELFQAQGIELETAESAEDGLEILEGRSFDVLILDLRLGGDDGSRILRTVRKRFPSMKVLLVTAHCDRQQEVRFLEQGVYRVIRKPCTIRTVYETVEKAAMTS